MPSLLLGQGYSVNISRNNISTSKLQDIWDKIAQKTILKTLYKAEYKQIVYMAKVLLQ